jgi:hypothetical protein
VRTTRRRAGVTPGAGPNTPTDAVRCGRGTVLDGIRTAGADVQVAKCDLTERRMYVQISSNSVAALGKSLHSLEARSGTRIEAARGTIRFVSSQLRCTELSVGGAPLSAALAQRRSYLRYMEFGFSTIMST